MDWGEPNRMQDKTNMTTLLHKLEQKTFRKFAFRPTLIANMRVTYYFMFVSIGLEFFAANENLPVAAAITASSFALMPFVVAMKVTSDWYLTKNNPRGFSNSRLIEFNDEGMTVKFDSGSYSFTKWEDIVLIQHKNEIARIFVSRQIAHLVPDKAWPSSVERDQFLALLQSKGLLK